MNPDPEYAGDATSLAEAVRRFEADGFPGQFTARDGGTVHCVACRTDSPASGVALSGLIRIEGASDPDDMVAVAALTCPRCGGRGTIALGYGPEAPVEDSDVLAQLSDERLGTGVDPG